MRPRILERVENVPGGTKVQINYPSCPHATLPFSFSAELDVYRADVSEAMAKLERLSMRSAELDEEQKEVQNAIAECERSIQIQNSSTKEEVFRLKGIPLQLLSHPIHLTTFHIPPRQTRGVAGSPPLEGDEDRRGDGSVPLRWEVFCVDTLRQLRPYHVKGHNRPATASREETRPFPRPQRPHPPDCCKVGSKYGGYNDDPRSE